MTSLTWCRNHAATLGRSRSRPLLKHGCRLSQRNINSPLGTVCVTGVTTLRAVPRSAIRVCSIDPLANTDGVYRPKKVLTIHSEDELKSLLETYQSKLVILMAKASHCKPCKKFMSTYIQYAERFSDCVFLDIIGDESPVTRSMMMAYKVKVTPAFYLYRDGVQQKVVTGIGSSGLLNSILALLAADEPGRDWVDPNMDDQNSDDE